MEIMNGKSDGQDGILHLKTKHGLNEMSIKGGDNVTFMVLFMWITMC